MNRAGRWYLLSVSAVLLAAAYPAYMGIRVLSEYFSAGAVDAASYPKYVIPYTPICAALLASLLLLPICCRLFPKRGLLPLSMGALALFFAFDLYLEQIAVFSGGQETALADWQMYLCVATPQVPVERYGDLIGEYSPAFKIHFYLIAAVMILAVLRFLYSLYTMAMGRITAPGRAVFAQGAAVLVFVGLCVLACFTAFFRTGTLLVSPVSAILMTVFFMMLGVTVGTYLCAIFYRRGPLLSVFVPVLGAVLTTAAMYWGETVLLGGNVYRFGVGLFFDPLGRWPLAAVDYFTILLTGLCAYAAAKFVNQRD